ncbi:geranylgeranyl diphosphate synthase type II [Enterococcus sp. PF1-24]|uniref:polyprenyl synthetase family protein n=1 Tax=unclassified Enterococcus TaxID=2608891 RepID=UPI0024767FF1|nr:MULTISPECIES: farnesyl diphosphate synthase [unclassified Enterococcus]MDH6364433.1 geranylgeranyl diphosphate synthase type II [Enterococcus sp. PFB1-1]MDH6401544.1 geranylgeranyl diphosphate synthase type II [Enterococcus sp. PF1-24]
MTLLDVFSKQHLPQVEDAMLEFIADNTNEEKLLESMTYSIKAGGKRLRPLLLLAVIDAFHVPITKGHYQVAAALEMIHTYSLIHDDLPAMDDDDLRRGELTNHKVYGEAMAILAGDGLLTAAFQLLSQTEITDLKKVILIQALTRAAGTSGMVAGQAADIEGEGQELTLEELATIHERKTGKLLEFAIVAGGQLTNQPKDIMDLLQEMAKHLGLAFQVRDDLLDVTATADILGKNVGRDRALGKNTYPSLLGVEESIAALAYELQQVEDCLIKICQKDLLFTESLLFEIVDMLRWQEEQE